MDQDLVPKAWTFLLPVYARRALLQCDIHSCCLRAWLQPGRLPHDSGLGNLPASHNISPTLNQLEGCLATKQLKSQAPVQRQA